MTVLRRVFVGAIFLPPARLGLRLCFYDTSTYLRFCRGARSTCGIKIEIRYPGRPHDAHDAGFLVAAGACAVNASKYSQYVLSAVFVFVNTGKEHEKTYSVGSTCAA